MTFALYIIIIIIIIINMDFVVVFVSDIGVRQSALKHRFVVAHVILNFAA